MVRFRPLSSPVLIAIVALGLGLRIAAAQGGLWLDEAWSALFVHDAASVASVLFGINHDNNHLLNSLWLHAIGFDAPPLLARAPAILCGTAAIPVAARIARRWGRPHAILAAVLFAASPILVTYGSEARGYAAMVLALLVATALTLAWLDDPTRPAPDRGIAAAVALGAAAQLTMVFVVPALVGAVLFARSGEVGVRRAVADAAALFGLALAGLAAMMVVTFLSPLLHGTRFQVGSYAPFDPAVFLHGQDTLLRYTIGFGPGAGWSLLATIVAIVIAARFAPRPRGDLAFVGLALIGLPVAVAVLRLGNSGFPRYFLLTSVAMLLLAARLGGDAIRRGGVARTIATVAAAAAVITMAIPDATLIAHRRGDPGRAVAVMAQAAPRGASVWLERNRSYPILATAAATRRFPLALRDTPCPAAAFLFVERDGAEAFPVDPSGCGARYGAIAGGASSGLSGTNWRLYARR